MRCDEMFGLYSLPIFGSSWFTVSVSRPPREECHWFGCFRAGQDPQPFSHFSQEVKCSSSRLQICGCLKFKVDHIWNPHGETEQSVRAFEDMHRILTKKNVRNS